MNAPTHHHHHGPCWHTSSLGGSTETAPGELSDLQTHLHTCHTLRGRLFGLRRHTDTLLCMAAGRIVTTVLALALLIGLIWLF